MTAYGYVFEVFDALYSGDPHELQTLSDRFFGDYWWSYWGAVFFNFVALQPLWWRFVRRSPWMLFAISTSVVIGMWLERYMILVTSLYRDFLVSSWGHYTPTFWDWAILLGSLGTFGWLFLMFVRFLPAISISEMRKLAQEKAEGAL
jgi:molybdopterin-containing oxidoreductase family membrane subunit